MGLTTKEISSSSFNDMISSVDRRSEYVENRAGANVRLNNFLTPYTLDDKSSILNAPCGYSNGVYPSLRPVGGENLLLQSNNFNTSWGENIGVSPRVSGQNGYDGTTDAWLLTKNASAFAYMFQDLSTSGLQTYSVYAKANTLSQITLYINASSNNYYGIFDLSNGSFIAGSNILSSNSNDIGNGWYRLSITINDTISRIRLYPDFAQANAGSIFIQDAQLEKGPRANKYIETTTSPAINADFSFTRGSAATRVTKDGLIKNVQILSGELVQNGDFSQIGSELIPDGNFTNQAAVDYWQIADTGGVERATKSLDNGFMRLTYDIANGPALFKGTLVQSGKSYKVTFRAKGTANSNFNSIGDNANIPSNPQYVVSNPTLTNDWQNYEFYVPVSSTVFRIYLASAQIGDTLDITNISVKEVGQNWNFVGGANMTDNGVSFIDDGTNIFSYVQQLGILTSGRKYRVSFDVIRYVSGLAQVELGSINTPVDISSGVGTYTIESESNNTFGLIKRDGSSPNFDFDVSNISIIEITDDTDLPRIDYTNGTGSLLLEPQSTNTATYSNDFTQGDIFNQSADPSLGASVLTQNQEKAPDGTNNGWLLKDNNNSVTGPAGLQYFSTRVNSDDFNTISIFAKKALSNDFLILETTSYDVSANGTSYFNISNGSLGNISTSHTAKIEDYGNGWYRCSITFQTTTDVQGAIYVRLASSNGQVNITRDGTNGVYIFGLQCEADATQNYATSYIPTSGSTVTRNQDLCNNAGSSDLINSTEGVLYAEISSIGNDGVGKYYSISDGTSSNRIRIGYSFTDNTIRALVISQGSSAVDYTHTISDVKSFSKVGFSYKQNEFSFWIDGVKAYTDTSGNTPTGLNSLQFDNGAGGGNFYGNVRSVAVFKEALTDEELAKITSTTQQEVFYEMRDKMLQINADYYEFGDYTTRLKKLF